MDRLEDHNSIKPNLAARGIAFLCFLAMTLSTIITIIFRDTTVNPWVYLDSESTSSLIWVMMPSIPSWLAFVIAVMSIVLLIVFPQQRLNAIPQRWYFRFIIALNLCLFVFQLYLADSIRYKVTWDPGILLSFAIDSEEGNDLEQYRWYFETYSNNNALAIFLRLIVRVALVCGIDPSRAASLVSAFLINVSGVMVFCSIYKIDLSRKVQLITFFGYTILAGLSLWIAVPYSDSYVSPFVSAALLCIVCIAKARRKRALLIASIGFGLSLSIGTLLKPTILIIGFALLVGIFLRHRSRVWAKNALIMVLAALLPFAVVMNVSTYYVEQNLGIEVNEDSTLTMSHFLMMGANPDRFGLHDSDDTVFSQSIEDKVQRTEENLRVFADRVTSMGPIGYAKFLVKKLVLTFCDGKFGVGLEGQHFPLDDEYLYPNPHGGGSQSLRELYYENRDLLDDVDQVIWYIILCSAPFSYLFFKKRVIANRMEWDAWVALIAMMSFVGLVIFFMLFETRTRYLYCFLPLFCLLSSFGLSALGDSFELKRRLSVSFNHS